MRWPDVSWQVIQPGSGPEPPVRLLEDAREPAESQVVKWAVWTVPAKYEERRHQDQAFVAVLVEATSARQVNWIAGHPCDVHAFS
jgi:hypothetical protein